MSITDNLNSIKTSIPDNVTLVAVSKTKPIKDLLEAYQAGQRIFGENKIQEMVEKQSQLPEDIEWHMIGHVQRNKVKYMASFVSLIHGIDNLKLLKEVNKQALKHERVIECLIQVKIATEDSKFGMSVQDAHDMLTSEDFLALRNVNIRGVMGMATFTDDIDQIEAEFKSLMKAFNKLKTIQSNQCDMEIVSMGMSGDYELAIECGSNMIRVGSSIFGARDYSN